MAVFVALKANKKEKHSTCCIFIYFLVVCFLVFLCDVFVFAVVNIKERVLKVGVEDFFSTI